MYISLQCIVCGHPGLHTRSLAATAAAEHKATSTPERMHSLSRPLTDAEGCARVESSMTSREGKGRPMFHTLYDCATPDQMAIFEIHNHMNPKQSLRQNGIGVLLCPDCAYKLNSVLLAYM